MSFEAQRWAYAWPCDFPSHKSVLNVVADLYNEKYGCAWPAVDTIAMRTGLTRRTVVRALRALEQSGLIETISLRDKRTGARLPSAYRLPFHREIEPSWRWPSWEPLRPEVSGGDDVSAR